MNKSARRLLVTTAIAVGTLYAGAWRAAADFIQTNLVSDLAALNATITDSNLKNPWGSSRSPTSPFWISNQGSDTATLYAVTDSLGVTKNALTVAIPTTGSAGPTGQVANFNADGTLGSSFVVNAGGTVAPARFIFANLDGSISAWNGTGTTAVVAQPPTTGTVYTGLAINQAVVINGQPQPVLYAANNAAGRIDVFNGTFQPVNSGAFATPAAISAQNLVPFNVQTLSNGNVAVTYAPVGRTAQTQAAPGMGAVAIFDATGTTLKQTILGTIQGNVNAPLASPWGITLAPAGFGPFGGDLLVGNFSFMASEINVFDASGNFLFTIPINVGMGNTPGGLWFLGFGTGGPNGGNRDTLFFTDGINGEMDGLFGAINVPGPIVGAGIPGLILASCGLLGWWRRRRQPVIA